MLYSFDSRTHEAVAIDGQIIIRKKNSNNDFGTSIHFDSEFRTDYQENNDAQQRREDAQKRQNERIMRNGGKNPESFYNNDSSELSPQERRDAAQARQNERIMNNGKKKN